MNKNITGKLKVCPELQMFILTKQKPDKLKMYEFKNNQEVN